MPVLCRPATGAITGRQETRPLHVSLALVQQHKGLLSLFVQLSAIGSVIISKKLTLQWREPCASVLCPRSASLNHSSSPSALWKQGLCQACHMLYGVTVASATSSGSISQRKMSAQQALTSSPSLPSYVLNRKITHRDVRIRRSQATVYNFLERPKDWTAISYHLLV